MALFNVGNSLQTSLTSLFRSGTISGATGKLRTAALGLAKGSFVLATGPARALAKLAFTRFYSIAARRIDLSGLSAMATHGGSVPGPVGSNQAATTAVTEESNFKPIETEFIFPENSTDGNLPATQIAATEFVHSIVDGNSLVILEGDKHGTTAPLRPVMTPFVTNVINYIVKERNQKNAPVTTLEDVKAIVTHLIGTGEDTHLAERYRIDTLPELLARFLFSGQLKETAFFLERIGRPKDAENMTALSEALLKPFGKEDAVLPAFFVSHVLFLEPECPGSIEELSEQIGKLEETNPGIAKAKRSLQNKLMDLLKTRPIFSAKDYKTIQTEINILEGIIKYDGTRGPGILIARNYLESLQKSVSISHINEMTFAQAESALASALLDINSEFMGLRSVNRTVPVIDVIKEIVKKSSIRQFLEAHLHSSFIYALAEGQKIAEKLAEGYRYKDAIAISLHLGNTQALLNFPQPAKAAYKRAAEIAEEKLDILPLAQFLANMTRMMEQYKQLIHIPLTTKATKTFRRNLLNLIMHRIPIDTYASPNLSYSEAANNSLNELEAVTASVDMLENAVKMDGRLPPALLLIEAYSRSVKEDRPKDGELFNLFRDVIGDGKLFNLFRDVIGEWRKGEKPDIGKLMISHPGPYDNREWNAECRQILEGLIDFTNMSTVRKIVNDLTEKFRHRDAARLLELAADKYISSSSKAEAKELLNSAVGIYADHVEDEEAVKRVLKKLETLE